MEGVDEGRKCLLRCGLGLLGGVEEYPAETAARKVVTVSLVDT